MEGITSRIAPDPTRDVPQRVDRNQADRASEETDSAPSRPPVDLFKSLPPEPRKIKMSWTPQDPGMLPVEKVEVEATNLGDGLVGPRVKISEPRDFPTPHADADGNYIFTPDDPRFDATQTYVTTTRTLGMAEKYLDRALPWGFSEDLGRNQLLVKPHAGSGVANAFYSAETGSLNFFSFTDPKTGEILRTGQSADVVAHETGHALLDAIRHNYMGSLSIAAGGYHESFGDMTAMIAALHDDAVVNRLKDETAGDLRKPNLVSRTAEQLGVGISHLFGGAQADSLRNAINNFKFADQHFYPYVDRQNPNQGMGQEPHAYSNIFTGTFYDVFCGLYSEAARDSSSTFKAAVESARDTAGRLLFRSAEFGPVGDPSYRDMALAFLKADDVDFGGAHRPLLDKVFRDRRILTADDIAAYNQHEKSLPEVKLEPGAATGKDGALAFLAEHRDALGVPRDIALDFVDARTNKRGETFLLFGSDRAFDLEGPDYGSLEGSRARATGGLLLAFDSSGRLLADNFQAISRRQEEDIRDHLKVAVTRGAITMAGASATQDEVWTPDGVAYLHLAQAHDGQGAVLQRSPVIWG